MAPDALLLFPGAGGDRNHHTLVALEDGLVGLSVERKDFPYRAKRKGPPDRPPKLIAAVREETDALRARGAHDVVLGGRSMGGRITSMAVAEGLTADGLVLLSYPLHPPGKPEKRRTDHFGAIGVPCLFISGTRDPFGTPDELRGATTGISAPVRIEWLEGQAHDPKGCDDEIVAIVGDWLGSL